MWVRQTARPSDVPDFSEAPGPGSAAGRGPVGVSGSGRVPGGVEALGSFLWAE